MYVVPLLRDFLNIFGDGDWSGWKPRRLRSIRVSNFISMETHWPEVWPHALGIKHVSGENKTAVATAERRRWLEIDCRFFIDQCDQSETSDRSSKNISCKCKYPREHCWYWPMGIEWVSTPEIVHFRAHLCNSDFSEDGRRKPFRELKSLEIFFPRKSDCSCWFVNFRFPCIPLDRLFPSFLFCSAYCADLFRWSRDWSLLPRNISFWSSSTPSSWCKKCLFHLGRWVDVLSGFASCIFLIILCAAIVSLTIQWVPMWHLRHGSARLQKDVRSPLEGPYKRCLRSDHQIVFLSLSTRSFTRTLR